MGQPPLKGLWPAIATPFAADGNVDADRLAELGRHLIHSGARGLALLGTTGEASSLGLGERHALIDAVIASGMEPNDLIIGTGAPSVVDAADLTRHAAEVGAAAVMLLPPFYFKPVSDAGLFSFVAEIIGNAGPTPPRMLLYHYPALAGVGWSFELIAALSESFPEVVVGLKDSSDEAHTMNLITAFPELAIFAGSEGHITEALAAGAAGLISANANVNCRALAELITEPDAPEAPRRLLAANAIRAALKTHGLVPSIKAVLAARTGDPAWRTLRPPLLTLVAEEEAALLADPAIARLIKTPWEAG